VSPPLFTNSFVRDRLQHPASSRRPTLMARVIIVVIGVPLARVLRDLLERLVQLS
jgi:hypothetical protein